ncbi:MAG: hypothetical protein QOD81_3339 [Solirubrobacteraceae bacterium]|nr:hypothetical protein [Solirubrobacteraceae bacterium]
MSPGSREPLDHHRPVAMGNSDGSGDFKVSRSGYTTPADCTVDVNDGSAAARKQIPGSYVVPPVFGDRKMFAVCGYLSSFVGIAGASGPDLGLAPWGLHPDPNLSVDSRRAGYVGGRRGHGSRWAAALASP